MFAVPKLTSLVALVIAGLASFLASAWLERVAPSASAVLSSRSLPSQAVEVEWAQQTGQFRQASLHRSFYMTTREEQ
jgi:hypothetical protein